MFVLVDNKRRLRGSEVRIAPYSPQKRKEENTMLELYARHLTLLCVGQFIAHFDYDDLMCRRYRSEYETTLAGTPLLFYCRADFDDKGEDIRNFDFEVETADRTPLRIVGSMRRAAEKAKQWINAYLKNYRTCFPQKTDDDES